MNPFSRFIRFKVAWWRTQLWLIRQSRLAWYLIGILAGWIICSEYQVYLKTGSWTTFPWQ